MRKFDPSLLPEPRDLQAFEPGDLPIDIEIGSGTGAFAIDYARTNPNRHLVAIEHTRIKFARFQSDLRLQSTIPNLTAVHANGISWVSQQLSRASVERYFFMYPNPNPKKEAPK